MPTVNSSAISFVEYDASTAELHVTFRTTGLYTYYGVPRHVHDALLAASSIGRFFNDNIRDQYSIRRFSR